MSQHPLYLTCKNIFHCRLFIYANRSGEFLKVLYNIPELFAGKQSEGQSYEMNLNLVESDFSQLFFTACSREKIITDKLNNTNYKRGKKTRIVKKYI